MNITYASLLIVSRDAAKLAALHTALTRLALYAATFTNQPSQISALMAHKPADIIILDVDLMAETADFLRLQAETGNLLPVLALGYSDDLPRLAQAITAGAAGYLLVSDDPVLMQSGLRPFIQNKLLQEQALSALDAFNEIERLADDLRLVILPLGIAISAEKDFDRLLERILTQAMDICRADAGALYLRTAENELRVACARVISLDIAMGGTTGNAVTVGNVPLYDALGEPNYENVAAYVALEAESINVDDIYSESGFDFSRNIRFDREHNYQSISCLTVPLRNGDVVGVMSLFNAQAPETGQVQPFSAYHQLVAESLASQATIVINNRRLQASEESLLWYKREMQIAREIQAGFLPAELPQPPGWSLEACFEPAKEVAGDFYDAFQLPHGRIGIVLADVCDKGIVAALFMALLRSLIRAFVQQHYFLAAEQVLIESSGNGAFQPYDEAALLNAVQLTNAYMGSNHSQTHMFATLFIGALDPETGALIYVNAGHNPPIVHRPGAGQRRLDPTGPAVGLHPDAVFRIGRLHLAARDTLLAFTDGITEVRDADGRMLGEAYLADLLTQHADGSLDTLLAAIQTAVYNHEGNHDLADDVTMLALRRAAAPDA